VPASWRWLQMAGRVHSICHEKVCIPDFLGLESIFSDPPWYRHLSFSSTTDTSVARVFRTLSKPSYPVCAWRCPCCFFSLCIFSNNSCLVQTRQANRSVDDNSTEKKRRHLPIHLRSTNRSHPFAIQRLDIDLLPLVIFLLSFFPHERHLSSRCLVLNPAG
jgi:hypothetical protein